MGLNITMIKRGCLIAARILSVLLVLWWTFFVFSSYGLCAVSTIESFLPLTVLFVTLVAWQRHLMGGLLFITVGILYLAWMWGCMYFDTFLCVFAPLFLAGILFVAAGALKNRRIAERER
jgi:hypothetical protein